MGIRNRDNKFNFFVPATFEKGTGEDGTSLIKIKGVASSISEDADGETLFPIGFDSTPFLSSGFLNYNHQGSKTSKAIVGFPIVAKPINDGRDYYIEGYLYPNEEAKSIIELGEHMAKYSPDRQWGFSIEGEATQRGSMDKNNPLYKKILKARVTGCAITLAAKNRNTWMDIVKGEYDKPFVDDEVEEKMCPHCINEPMIKGKCVACGYEEKAIDTEAIAPVTPESVEHGIKKNNNNLINFGECLKKSEIYTLLLDRFPNNIADINRFYSFVVDVQKHINNVRRS